MIELTRTLRQWWATARRLEHRKIGRPDLALQIRWAFPEDPHAPPDTPITVNFIEVDAAVVQAEAPLTAWWMPASPGWRVQPSDWGRPRHPTVGNAEAAVAAAETIIRDHQRRRR
ncbi:MAG: hypothetical protein M3Q03_21385 [Chloroflexota bacterium]|nr:hypothetical protein [Chloroflexota bacterium]